MKFRSITKFGIKLPTNNKFVAFFAVLLLTLTSSAIANFTNLNSVAYAIGEPSITSVVPNTAMNVGGDIS